MKAPGAPFSFEVISSSVIKPQAAGGSNGNSNSKSSGGSDATLLSAFDATIGQLLLTTPAAELAQCWL